MTIRAEMSAIAVAAPGGPEVLALTALPTPQPAPGEALIRVAAAGVNAPDLAQRRGDYPPPAGASPLLGLEVSGQIAVASGEWRVGDKVVALCNGGGYADYVARDRGFVFGEQLPSYQQNACEMNPKRSGLYLRYQLYVAYLLDREHLTPEKMLTGRIAELAIDRRLRAMQIE